MAVLLLLRLAAYTIYVLPHLILSIQFKQSLCVNMTKMMFLILNYILVHYWPAEGLEFKIVGNSLRYWFDYVRYFIITLAFQASLSYLIIYFTTPLILKLPPMRP